jgi:hypothetical protein
LALFVPGNHWHSQYQFILNQFRNRYYLVWLDDSIVGFRQTFQLGFVRYDLQCNIATDLSPELLHAILAY